MEVERERKKGGKEEIHSYQSHLELKNIEGKDMKGRAQVAISIKGITAWLITDFLAAAVGVTQLTPKNIRSHIRVSRATSCPGADVT